MSTPDIVNDPVPALDGFWDVSNQEYHADRTHDSHSTLEVFRRSVLTYQLVYVEQTMTIEQSAAQELGTAVHTAILEPERFAAEYLSAPSGIDRRTKIGKAAYEEFQSASEGKTVLSADDFALVLAMRSGVSRNRNAWNLLTDSGFVEASYRWQHPCGLRIKCRADKLLPSSRFILDLKTAIDPTPDAWRRSAASYGYHRQAALYCQGMYELTGSPWCILHVVVGKSPPHECIVYELSPESLDLGEQQNSVTAKHLLECKTENNWSGHHLGNVVPVNLPGWAYQE